MIGYVIKEITVVHDKREGVETEKRSTTLLLTTSIGKQFIVELDDTLMKQIHGLEGW
jgi:hypothetical protein